MRTLVTYVTEVTDLRVKVRRKRQKILDKETLHHWLWEWQPIGATEWYPINENNVVPAPILRRNLPEMQKYREARERINQGETIEFDAVYKRDYKQLFITRVHGPSPFSSSPFEKMEENIKKLKNQPVEVFA